MGFFQQLSNFTEENIVFSLTGARPRHVFLKLLNVFYAKGDIDADLRGHLVEALVERERKGSTAVGKGLVLPHLKTGLVQSSMVSIGIHRAGLDLGAMDKQVSHIFILSLFPERMSGMHLKFLASVSRSMYNITLREKILSAASANDIYELLLESI